MWFSIYTYIENHMAFYIYIYREPHYVKGTNSYIQIYVYIYRETYTSYIYICRETYTSYIYTYTEKHIM